MSQSPTGIEALVAADIADRQAQGITKYGVTVEDNPLSLLEWLQHLYEELLDGAVCARRAIEYIGEGSKPYPCSLDGVAISWGDQVYLEDPDDPGKIISFEVEAISKGLMFDEYNGGFTLMGDDCECGDQDVYHSYEVLEFVIKTREDELAKAISEDKP